MKALALLFIPAWLAAQVQPAPGWCSMAHCNNQMTDYNALPAFGLSGSVYVKARDTTNFGGGAGLGCVSNGKNVACTYRQTLDSLVYYDGDGNILWTSGALLDVNAYTSAPLIEADGSVVVGDDLHLIKFSSSGKVMWSTPAAGGSPISVVTTPNGAIFSATGIVYANPCPLNNCILIALMADGGSAYTTASVTFSGGDCPGAAATPVIAGGHITAINVTSQGTACLEPPDLFITGDGSGAHAYARLISQAPVAVYDGKTGAQVGHSLLLGRNASGHYYEAYNTPCVNNGSYPNRVYVSTQLNSNPEQGEMWALDIDPTNHTQPISTAWTVVFDGPSGASPLCAGNNIYFDGAGYLPGDDAGTTIFGVQDNGTSASMLFHVSLGPGAGAVTCNYALDPRPIGGFWHKLKGDPTIYHRDSVTGDLIESINVSNLVVANGAPEATYTNTGVFTVLGAADHPYLVMPQSAQNIASYMVMIDLTDGSLVWSLPFYPGNSPFPLDSQEGAAALVMDSTGQPVIATSGWFTGGYFIAEGAQTLALSASSLTFGGQDVGSQSATQTIQAINNASSVLNIGSVSASGDFSQTNTCTAPLAPSASCDIAVTFKPTATGSRTGTIAITDNATGSPQIVTLSGTGTLASPRMALSTTALRFGAHAAGTTSQPQAATLTNTGKAPLFLTSVSASGSAVQSNACPSTLAPGASCVVNAMLHASGTGPQSGAITITGNASNSPQTVSLSGTGIATPSVAAGLSSTSVAFAAQTAGISGAPQTVTLVSAGTATLNILNITATGGATQSNNCGVTLAPGAQCQIVVNFVAAAPGPGSGAVSIADNALNSPQSIAVSGIGLPNPVPFLNAPTEPPAQPVGGPEFPLSLFGAGLVPTSVVQWNGVPLSTSFLGNAQLTATVPAALLTKEGTASISVVNPPPGGGTSNVLWLSVTTANTIPIMGLAGLPIGEGAQSVSTADFNGDGHPDLAVAVAGANAVSILLGNGNGEFSHGGSYATGLRPASVATGDFNGDGKIDMAVAYQTGSQISVLLGKGDGTFAFRKNFATGNTPISVVAGDFNRDGYLDLAVANRSDGTVSILLGKGDGTFATHVDYAAGQAPNYIVAGDFNGDGHPDLAVANDFAPGGGFSILLGNGDGTFQAPLATATGDAVALAATDLNGDGILDLAVINRLAESFAVVLGNGDGTFQSVTETAMPGLPDGLLLADLNGDGTMEAIVSHSQSNDVSVLPGNGDGTFRPSREFSTGAGPVGLVAADFNGDGAMDLAVAAAGSKEISILSQQAAAALSADTLHFKNVKVGAASSQTITLENGGSAPMQITGIAAGGMFSEANTCPPMLVSGALCSITTTFAPTAKGNQTGVLTINDSAPGSPQTISLAGVGTR